MKNFKNHFTLFLITFVFTSFIFIQITEANSILIEKSNALYSMNSESACYTTVKDTFPEFDVIDIEFSDSEEEEEEEIFMIVEQSPRFPGCEDMEGSKEKKESCAQKRMNEFIYENLEYPSEARKKNIQGQVIIQFVVEKDGSISDIYLVRKLGGGCGEEALRLVEEMKNLPEKWTPGKQRGRPVRVKYTLPVKFKLNG